MRGCRRTPHLRLRELFSMAAILFRAIEGSTLGPWQCAPGQRDVRRGHKRFFISVSISTGESYSEAREGATMPAGPNGSFPSTGVNMNSLQN